jgi:hypothetical protein
MNLTNNPIYALVSTFSRSMSGAAEGGTPHKLELGY